MSNARSAIIVGASGSVGQALVEAALQPGSFTVVVTLVRTPRPEQAALAQRSGVELRQRVVEAMTPATLEAATTEAIRALPDGDVAGLSALGVGGGTSKLTLDEHRAIDVELNAAFARALATSGRVRHLAFMSAAGADPTASTAGTGAAGFARYNRVKGESEEAVKAAGPSVVSVFRPAMIIGSRHTPFLLEKVLPLFSFMTPERFRSISVQQIAAAMVAASVRPPEQSAVFHFPEMMRLIRAHEVR